jgi:hypothetical protein
MADDRRKLTERVEDLENAAEVVTSQLRGVRRRSTTKFAGWPLYEIAMGPDIEHGELRGHARAIVAIGDVATGVIAIGGWARGGLAIGGCAMGLISFGGCAIGVLAAVGGVAIGGVAVGGAAVGIVAIGGAALGYWGMGGAVFGKPLRF